jgi:hypothetical protein
VVNVDRLLEAHGVHGSKRVSFVRFDNFQHARAEAFPGLCGRRSAAELRDAGRVPHVVLHRHWKAQKIALGRPDPVQRFLVGGRNTTHSIIIPVLGYSGKRALSLVM